MLSRLSFAISKNAVFNCSRTSKIPGRTKVDFNVKHVEQEFQLQNQGQKASKCREFIGSTMPKECIPIPMYDIPSPSVRPDVIPIPDEPATIALPEKVSAQELPVACPHSPELADHEVLLEIDCIGICNSHSRHEVNGQNFAAFIIGDFLLSRPLVIGQEASGIVVKVGNGVKHLRVGDRVAIEPGVPCRNCDFCKKEKFCKCSKTCLSAKSVNDCGGPHSHYKHDAEFCFRLPDNVTMEEGALLEPLSVALSACRNVDVRPGSELMIVGADTIGLLALLVAKERQAQSVLVVDYIPQRLDMAKEMGATHTLLMESESCLKTTSKKIRELLGRKPKKTINCCGKQNSVLLAIKATCSGGSCVIIDNGLHNQSDMFLSDFDVSDVHRYSNDYCSALDLLSNGKVNIKPLITHHFDYDDINLAFETAHKAHDRPMKVMVHVQPKNKNNGKH